MAEAHEELCDVAIVGFGPVGATLANLLALQGLRVLVFEREAEVYRLPRAVHFDGECMRVFQAVGIADELMSGLVVAPGMRFVDAAGRVLIDWQRPTTIGPQGWHASYRFHQPTLESALRRRLAQHPRVRVALRHDVFCIDEKDGAVHLRHEDLSSGRLGSSRARWVVGCDGARSLVRRFMGTELDDLRSHERWLVVDLILKRPRPDLGDYSVQFCDPRRPATYVRGPGDRRRWELMLMPGDDLVEMTRPERIWSLLERWVTPQDAVLERPAVYTFHSVVARGWRRGRLLIAGDAAHQTPPFLGQGMCAGIRDAANLAWKLAAIVGGSAPPALLESYESERAPHVREFIETAVRLGAVIQSTDAAAAARRDEAMAANPQAFATPQPRLGPGAYDGQPDCAGTLALQPVLADGRRLDDDIGYRAALLVRPASAQQAALLLGDREPAAVDCRLVVAESAAVQAVLDDCRAEAVLLRPDRQVFGIAAEREEIAGLLRRAAALGVVRPPLPGQAGPAG